MRRFSTLVFLIGWMGCTVPEPPADVAPPPGMGATAAGRTGNGFDPQGPSEDDAARRTLYRASAMDMAQGSAVERASAGEAAFEDLTPAQQDDLADRARTHAREQDAELNQIATEWMGRTGDLDCDDFASHAEAQAFYEAHGPGDRHLLDLDRNGVACESML